MSIPMPIHMSIHMPTHMPAHMPIHMSMHMSIPMPIGMPMCVPAGMFDTCLADFKYWMGKCEARKDETSDEMTKALKAGSEYHGCAQCKDNCLVDPEPANHATCR